LSPTFLRPETLIEAVQILAEYGQRTCIIGGSEYPPPGLTPSHVIIDASRLTDMAGIHQLGGRIAIGVNTPHSAIARSSLIRTHGVCLAEACEEANHPAASLLLYDFQALAASPPTLPALVALDAEIESAWDADKGAVERGWSGLDSFGNPAIARDAHMVLAVRFSVGGAASGSASIFAAPPAGTDALLRSAAVRLSLDAAKRVIVAAKIVLAPRQGAPFSSPAAAELLRNHPPTPDLIEQAAHAALLDAQQHLPASTPKSTYRIELAAHLVRRALDRALARALRGRSPGRL
jgi:CO/xanthine dehydrogenase FAD-binding subunit